MKLRTSIVLEIEYDSEKASAEELQQVFKETATEIEDEYIKLIDAHTSPYDIQMTCPECKEWVTKRPGKDEPSAYGDYQHTENCSHYPKVREG